MAIVDPLVWTLLLIGKRFASATNIDSVIRDLQQPMVRTQNTTPHPAAMLLDSYSKDGFPALVGERWLMEFILTDTKTGLNKLSLAKDAVHFVRSKLLECTEHSFSIILTKDDALKYFGNRLRISRLASVD